MFWNVDRVRLTSELIESVVTTRKLISYGLAESIFPLHNSNELWKERQEWSDKDCDKIELNN